MPFALMVIKRDYQSLVEVLECCEGMEYTIAKASQDLQALSFGEVMASVKTYLEKRLHKNSGLQEMVGLSRKDVAPSLYASLQQCTATSVNVERSFSILKKLLAKDRNFSDDNVEKYLIKLYNSSARVLISIEIIIATQESIFFV